jgi:hypothetical protein
MIIYLMIAKEEYYKKPAFYKFVDINQDSFLLLSITLKV